MELGRTLLRMNFHERFNQFRQASGDVGGGFWFDFVLRPPASMHYSTPFRLSALHLGFIINLTSTLHTITASRFSSRTSTFRVGSEKCRVNGRSLNEIIHSQWMNFLRCLGNNRTANLFNWREELSAASFSRMETHKSAFLASYGENIFANFRLPSCIPQPTSALQCSIRIWLSLSEGNLLEFAPAVSTLNITFVRSTLETNGELRKGIESETYITIAIREGKKGAQRERKIDWAMKYSWNI